MQSIPLWVIAGGSVLMGAVALLSSWGLLAPELWWQALLSLGVIMVTMWSAIGALRFMNKEEDGHWFPKEAVWTLVGIVMIYVIIIATYVAPAPSDASLYYDLDTLLPAETDTI